jgi:hypothetical protein
VVFAAADTGLLAGAAPDARAQSAGPAAPRLVWPEEPGIERVHQAALAYLRLGPNWMDSMKRGVARRGLLPVVVLHGALAHDTSRATAWDEAVSGGDLWRLVDQDRDRAQDYDVGLTFSWDLGDLAYNPEEIDVSREAREVIELRDDVLDEITQLYFERRRVLAQLQLLPDPGDAERVRLRLRADELAAGIDAWTGGWFGRQTARPRSGRAASPALRVRRGQSPRLRLRSASPRCALRLPRAEAGPRKGRLAAQTHPLPRAGGN